MSHAAPAVHAADKGRFLTFPGSPFRLNQLFLPAGDQPEAIDKLAEGLQDGLANKTLAAQLYSEFREFFPENAVEYFVSYYDYYQPEAYVPARDLYIEKDSSINEHIEQMRLSATKSLLERNDAVIVATVSAIYGLGSPESYHGLVVDIRQGQEYPRQNLLKDLIR